MKERTNEELNRIIAEWRGWKEYDNQPPLCRWKHEPTGFWNLQPPDYCSDANAIDAEVRRLDFNDQCSVCDEIVRRADEEACYTTRSMAICFAPPRVKAEAVVKVIEEGRR